MALSSGNALDVLRGYDVIVDGTDNFPTRYLVNDACVILGIPNAYGSIFRFEGQASVFAAKDGPCYRCLYPEPPPPGLVPSCAEGGVLGVLCGVVGTIQATEAVKLIMGVGEPLIGALPGLRRAPHALPRAEAAQGPGLPGLRRQPHRHRADRLRAVLRQSPRPPRRRNRPPAPETTPPSSSSSRASTAGTASSSSTSASRRSTRSAPSPARR